ncbi:class I SAM-dependent methyltransferase [Nocardia huaxiensis]|uniref:Class I SAM-dependent methyltransferase n=1 Tax=Nocardia huaxiensis TaxID=2755382 RepID=A0A7D6V7Q7_9NOCA|nr:class I SAM-dependent methyltransferase [Nocardia huaxiensis]QLY29712.1 class I SAM-dependent methyltransferase [Nocardia huaxiensis]UFS96712.1 class I SAM-dependent methyltransferase [Nocardia huaxiensis]
MTSFDLQASRNYDRRATRLLTGLYRHITADVNRAAAKGATVLDIGTGPGKLLSHMADARPDLRLHGVDLSPHMITLAADRLSGRAEPTVGDVAALPYPDASFEVVVSSLSLHEWPDVTAAVGELHRVLAPGGLVALYDFRFVRVREARVALAAAFGPVRREVVRPQRHPIGLFLRLSATGRA